MSLWQGERSLQSAPSIYIGAGTNLGTVRKRVDKLGEGLAFWRTR